jgi:hypothetical protein
MNCGYEKEKQEIIRMQSKFDGKPESLEQIYNLFDLHRENIMKNCPEGPKRNAELSNLLMNKVKFTLKFSNGLYKNFMVVELEDDLTSNLPSNVTELVILPSDWYTGPVKTRITEIPAGLFMYERRDENGKLTRPVQEGKNITLRIAPGITEIGDYSFNNPRFSKVYLPNTIKKIQDGAFMGCSFETIYVPPSVNYIGTGAFSNNTNLTSVTGMKNVTTIKGAPFYNTSLEFIELWTPLDSIHHEPPSWNGDGGSVFDVLNGTRLSDDDDDYDSSPIYDEIQKATLQRENAFILIEKFTGTKLECGKNTPGEIKKCLLNIPSTSYTSGFFTEQIKYLGCRVLGYMKPDSMEEFSNLYGLGIQCFNIDNIMEDIADLYLENEPNDQLKKMFKGDESFHVQNTNSAEDAKLILSEYVNVNVIIDE